MALSAQQPKSTALAYFNLLRLLATLSLLVARGCFLVLENSQEINGRLMWASTGALTILTMYLVSSRQYSFDEFVLYFSVGSTLHGVIVVWQMLRGDYKDAKEGAKRVLAAAIPAAAGLAIAVLKSFLPMIEVILYLASLAFTGLQVKIKGELTFNRSALVLAMIISMATAILF